MKTKNLVLIASILFISFTLNAQIKFGLRAGLSSSNIKLKDYTASGYKLEYNKGQYGYHFGVISRIKILKLFVQPEVLFSTSKTDILYIDLKDPQKPVRTYGRQNFNKIDIPVMVGFKVAIFKLEVGPVATFMLNTKSDLLDEKKVEQNMKGATVGYQAGIGVELSSLLLDFKYEGNLSKLGSSMEKDGTTINFDQRMSQFLFSIGYLF
jgi:hypothetical protein